MEAVVSAADAFGWLRDTVLRMFPHPTRTGLRALGAPGPNAPVLVTGNFTLTVDRLRRVLGGRDAWLLVANSRGINVWCAAGGGHLTHHDVIAAVRASRVGDRVGHRELILPQLAATGVERRRIEEATGWKTRWGPARLEDLPEFLDRGAHVVRRYRFVRFPLWERCELASLWALPLALVALLVLGLVLGWAFGAVATGVVVLAVLAVFVAIPWVPITGPRRWLTLGGAAAGATALGAGILATLGPLAPSHVVVLAATCGAAMALLSIDIAGTTPWYPSGINSFRNQFNVELVTDRCTGAAECVQVCPRDVLAMNGPRRKVEIARPDDCIRCGACIVQCPEDALRFRFDDGRVVEPATVRRTRLNMLGRRTVEVEEPAADAPA
jgi:NAD-dependent dihydropyrimidine dehydrogenase PreA subunit